MSKTQRALSLRGFILRHRDEIDNLLERYAGVNAARLNMRARAEYVLRDAGLASWAEEEGVQVETVTPGLLRDIA